MKINQFLVYGTGGDAMLMSDVIGPPLDHIGATKHGALLTHPKGNILQMKILLCWGCSSEKNLLCVLCTLQTQELRKFPSECTGSLKPLRPPKAYGAQELVYLLGPV